MASAVYNTFKSDMLSGNVDLANDTIKLSLHTSTYTPDIDADEFYDDVDNEVGASGTYAAGGATLTATVATDDTDDEGVFDATDVSFASATITARYAIIYKVVGAGTPADDPLVLYIDFGSNQTSTNGTFTITFAAEGILNIG